MTEVEVAAWRDKNVVMSTLLLYVRAVGDARIIEESCRNAADKLIQMGFRCVDPETEKLKARISRLEGWAGLASGD